MGRVDLEEGAEGILSCLRMPVLKELLADGQVLRNRLLRLRLVGLLSLCGDERPLNHCDADDTYHNAGAPERTDVQTSSRARLGGDRDHKLFVGLRVR